HKTANKVLHITRHYGIRERIFSNDHRNQFITALFPRPGAEALHQRFLNELQNFCTYPQHKIKYPAYRTCKQVVYLRKGAYRVHEAVDGNNVPDVVEGRYHFVIGMTEQTDAFINKINRLLEGTGLLHLGTLLNTFFTTQFQQCI